MGMGQEDYQEHTIECVSCGEDIKVALIVNYKDVTHEHVAIENAIIIDEQWDAPIVNVDANFLIPSAMKNQDFSFARLEQMQDQLKSDIDAGLKLESRTFDNLDDLLKNWKRPNFGGEWKLLRKSWSLESRGKIKLANQKKNSAEEQFYNDENLEDLTDWVFRYCTKISGRTYLNLFDDLMKRVKPILNTQAFEELYTYYRVDLLAERRVRYFSLFTEFFQNFSEFGQVHFFATRGMDLDFSNSVSSVNFDKTKMFYGNAYEVFSSNVDVLAYLNNIISGRKYDEFERLNKDSYLKLDNASKFNAFGMNTAFTAVCSERDNGLRNASHHRNLNFEKQNQIISYRSGKGGQGDFQFLFYGDYLFKCVKIFLQATVMLRLEILMCFSQDKKMFNY